MYKDIREVREHYAALRDLIAQNPGGRDAECRQRLRLVDQHAAALFSGEEHRKWDRPQMTGADYLRLQILIALEGVNTRLFFLSAMRDREIPHLAHPAGTT